MTTQTGPQPNFNALNPPQHGQMNLETLPEDMRSQYGGLLVDLQPYTQPGFGDAVAALGEVYFSHREAHPDDNPEAALRAMKDAVFDGVPAPTEDDPNARHDVLESFMGPLPTAADVLNAPNRKVAEADQRAKLIARGNVRALLYRAIGAAGDADLKSRFENGNREPAFKMGLVDALNGDTPEQAQAAFTNNQQWEELRAAPEASSERPSKLRGVLRAVGATLSGALSGRRSTEERVLDTIGFDDHAPENETSQSAGAQEEDPGKYDLSQAQTEQIPVIRDTDTSTAEGEAPAAETSAEADAAVTGNANNDEAAEIPQIGADQEDEAGYSPRRPGRTEGDEPHGTTSRFRSRVGGSVARAWYGAGAGLSNIKAGINDTLNEGARRVGVTDPRKQRVFKFAAGVAFASTLALGWRLGFDAGHQDAGIDPSQVAAGPDATATPDVAASQPVAEPTVTPSEHTFGDDHSLLPPDSPAGAENSFTTEPVQPAAPEAAAPATPDASPTGPDAAQNAPTEQPTAEAAPSTSPSSPAQEAAPADAGNNNNLPAGEVDAGFGNKDERANHGEAYVPLGEWDPITGEGSVEHVAADQLGLGDTPPAEWTDAQQAAVRNETNRLLELNGLSLKDAEELPSDKMIRVR